jgi:hypothetical protein
MHRVLSYLGIFIWLTAVAFGQAAKNDSATTFTGVLQEVGQIGNLPSSQVDNLRHEDGYRGIWYFNQPQKDEYVYKYSGGLGTYCADHIPMAYYSKEANKTFFVYGGGGKDGRSLHEMVSYYDHATGMVPRPTDLIDKKTDDAHDNPTIMLDAKGYVWVFAAAHGTARPAYIFRSRESYSIDAFDLIEKTNFSYPQPWYFGGKGFLFLHTRYDPAHSLYWMTSPDGVTWTKPSRLASIEQGHYQVSWPWKDKLGTAFNYHPKVGGLNARTNLYYLETGDFGRTWRNVQGEQVEVPLRSIKNKALVHDYKAEKLLVYICDINYDQQGRPIILYITSRGYEAGPKNGPRIWTTAHWTGEKWEIAGSIQSDSNYDMGSLYVEPGGAWRIVGPTEPGPQPFNPGGEVAMWVSRDQGESWTKEKQLTRGSEFNHTYVRRPVNAHPDFYAYWADGHARQPSISRLYFADKSGNVYRLPVKMTKESQPPEQVK